MALLLDTHFLVWLVLGSKRLAEFPWLDRYRPWGISPVSLLEIQFLAKIGRLSVRNPDFTKAVMDDMRFAVDDIMLGTLVPYALPLDWTSDPLDRLLVAHSSARPVVFCTTDRNIRDHHSFFHRNSKNNRFFTLARTSVAPLQRWSGRPLALWKVNS